MNSATVDSLLHWLLRTSLEASILIVAVLALRWLLGTRLSPAWRIGLWMIVGMKLMLPAFIPAGFGLGGWFTKGASLVQPMETRTPAVPLTASTQEATSHPERVTPTHTLTAASSMLPSSFHLSHILLLAWLTGSAAILCMAVARQRRFDLLLRRRPRATSTYLQNLVTGLAEKAGVKRSVSIVLMAPGTTPAMVGILQPKLLLPEDWESRFDDRSLRHVVLHELLHVKQRDLLWNWAAITVQALHWFNPLVWFVVSRFQADRELRCDAGALSLLSPAERLHYGHTLLRIQESFFAPPAIAGLAPCVRNHPTLRQRILMITHPTTRQPWLQALLIFTISLLVGYSFTTARAQEKEVPPKIREGETIKKTAGDANTPVRQGEGEREGGMKKSREGEREGRKPSAEREGGTKKPGMRDGESARKPGTGDGEKPRTGMRDGERPRTAERDGMKKTGERDGEGRPSAESGSKSRKGEGDTTSAKSSEVITMHVNASGDTILINGEKQPLRGLRGHLSTFLPEHPGAKVIVSGEPDTPLKSLHEIVDAVRDNGNKNVGIKTE